MLAIRHFLTSITKMIAGFPLFLENQARPGQRVAGKVGLAEGGDACTPCGRGLGAAAEWPCDELQWGQIRFDEWWSGWRQHKPLTCA